MEFVEIKFEELPNFIRASKVFVDLDTTLPVSIPKDLIVKDNIINSKDKYKQFLNIVDYFKIQEPIGILIFENDKKNEDYILNVLTELIEKKDNEYIKNKLKKFKIKISEKYISYDINIKIFNTKSCDKISQSFNVSDIDKYMFFDVFFKYSENYLEYNLRFNNSIDLTKFINVVKNWIDDSNFSFNFNQGIKFSGHGENLTISSETASQILIINKNDYKYNVFIDAFAKMCQYIEKLKNMLIENKSFAICEYKDSEVIMWLFLYNKNTSKFLKIKYLHPILIESFEEIFFQKIDEDQNIILETPVDIVISYLYSKNLVVDSEDLYYDIKKK